MEHLTHIAPLTWGFAILVTLIAGTIKGMVGFAMPMVMIAGIASFSTPELALAGLILPTLVSNIFQAGKDGWQAVREAVIEFRLFLIIGAVTLVAAAQVVAWLNTHLLLAAIGTAVVLFGTFQLAGWRLKVAPHRRTRAEVILGTVAGTAGGLSGMWGPPTVVFLTALNTEKEKQIRVQGVVFGAGALLLAGAHMNSGLLNSVTLPFSAAMIIPAMLGMIIGGRISAHADQQSFRKLTLIVLVIAGANLIRRGLIG